MLILQVVYSIVFVGRINTEKKFMKTKQRYRENKYSEYELQESIQQTQDNPEDE